MRVRKRIEIEVFHSDLDTLKNQICGLKDLLPKNTELKITESLIPYSVDTIYPNYSTSEILKKEMARLHENKYYHKRAVLAEVEMEEAEFMNVLENAGFVVIRKIG